ncbi:MAG: hypothetical protein UT86_C0001G0228 [Candidatus Magasanikbacteria bacterium GW2011_GWC2_40_17]|uniref:TraD/TraG TraM recognition site domain-containing protein n=1 Tax=Candidatus Magasanikbacteria bacterium GW2011_GWA2_42_32 TaxID=1619039 RepID=A0A0G1D6C7_9BACT|nr:MAG: hypothetical protein UT86_C0001G0228 [Candidatus Magasanikbacteria bacterium GW2011_GWC2_40_17]KKS57588.1 MAG: hypothetical protein UV20_C0001G0228 [Candidatus Magasanikbacteria bacterium GW2011_GWA2_42_32]
MITDTTTLALALGRLGRRKKPSDATPPVGVVVGQTNAGAPVLWPSPSLSQASHSAVLAASGAGKTILTSLALLGEIASDNGHAKESRQGTVVLDPKGDLISTLLMGLAAELPERLSDVVYLNPFVGGFHFNLSLLALGKTPLDIRAHQIAALVAAVSTGVGSQAHLGAGARQIDVLEGTTLAALDCDHPEASVLWALDALTQKKGMGLLAKATRSRRARQFLEGASLSDELKASCSSRLRLAFAASADLERIATAPGCLSFAEIFAPGKIVLVDLGEPTGGLVSLQTFWANMFLRLATEFLMERPSPYSGHHVRTVCDEAQVVAEVLSDVAERILTTGRSRGISLTVLSQGTALLADASPTLLKVIFTNTPARFVGRLAAPDAELLSRELAPGPGIDEPIGALRSRFSATVSNLPDRGFYLVLPGKRQRFTARTANLEAWKTAAETRQAEIAQVKSRFALKNDQPARRFLSEVVGPAAAKPKAKATVAGQLSPTTPKTKPASRWG